MCGWTRMVGVSLFVGGLTAVATITTAVPAAQEGGSQVVVRAVTGDGQPVLDRQRDGVVIRGAKLHITGASFGHDLMVMPTKNMKPGEEDYAIACAVPVTVSDTTAPPRHGP